MSETPAGALPEEPAIRAAVAKETIAEEPFMGETVGDGLTAETSPNKLTPSDHGQLPETTRKVLVQLLRGPYVSRERHSKNWAALFRAEDVIRERLGDLFLELVVDTDLGVAFVRNMESAEVELPKVIRSQRLTLIDTALVLFLREQLLGVEGTGRRAMVGRTDILDQLSVYRNTQQMDEAAFNKKVRASIDKMKAQSVLISATEDDRFEVSPILRLVFDADQVIAATKEIKRLADGATTAFGFVANTDANANADAALGTDDAMNANDNANANANADAAADTFDGDNDGAFESREGW